MLHTLEELNLESLLLRLHDIYRPITKVIGESRVNLRAGEEQWACSSSVSVSAMIGLERHTRKIVKVRLLQESRMGKCAGRTHSIFCKLIRYIWRAKAITDTGELGTLLAILFLDLRNPFRNVFVGDGEVLLQPLIEVEIGISSCVVFGLSMFPYRILFSNVTLAKCLE